MPDSVDLPVPVDPPPSAIVKITDGEAAAIRRQLARLNRLLLDRLPPVPKPRGTSLGPPERALLEAWGLTLRDAFGEMPYLVGSVARADRSWRDVDVRLMLPDADPLLADPTRAAALNVAMSLWGQKATGLPIDFQFQDHTTTNAEHNGRRIPIGMRGRSDA